MKPSSHVSSWEWTKFSGERCLWELKALPLTRSMLVPPWWIIEGLFGIFLSADDTLYWSAEMDVLNLLSKMLFVSYLYGTLYKHLSYRSSAVPSPMPVCISWFKTWRVYQPLRIFSFRINSLFCSHFWPAWVGLCTIIIFVRLSLTTVYNIWLYRTGINVVHA